MEFVAFLCDAWPPDRQEGFHATVPFVWDLIGTSRRIQSSVADDPDTPFLDEERTSSILLSEYSRPPDVIQWICGKPVTRQA